MGQFKDGDSRTINGVTYVRQNGSWLPQGGAVPIGGPDPSKPLDLKSKQIGVQKGEADLALTPYQLRKQRADAETAEINAKTAREQYAAQHPSVGESGLFGAPFLKTLSQSDQSMVKALAEGRLAFPTGSALRSPFWQEKLSQVSQFDPTFDATNYNTRAQARVNAAKGKLGQSNNALNTAIGHVGQLYSQIDGTASHGGFPFATTVNAVENAYKRGSGDPGVTNFEQTAGLVADELEAAYRNGGGAEAGVVRQLRSLDPNLSREQKVGLVRNALELLSSKVAANMSQYNFGLSGNSTWDMLDPHVKDTLAAVAPDIGQKYFGATAASGPPGALPGNNGTPPPVGPQSPSGGAPAVPQADYSGMIGGPGASLATMDPNSQMGAFKQTYRNEFDPVQAGAISAFIKHGTPYETAAAYSQSHGFMPPDPKSYAQAVAFARTHHGATNVEANRLVPTTLGERLASSPLSAAAASAASAGTAGFLDAAGRAVAGPQWDANRAALSVTNPTADLVGNVAGGAGAMIGGGEILGGALRAGAKAGVGRNLLALAIKNPIKAGALADGLYGAVYGANESPDNPLGGAALGAAGGAGGGMFGSVLSNVAGKVIGGVADPAVQRLRAAGIPLTTGEVLGPGFKKAQDALTSLPGPGTMIARRYADGREALNRAAFGQAGEIIGAPIANVGQAGIRALDAAKSRAYADALNPVQINLDTPEAISGYVGAIRSAKAIPNVDQASDLASGALENYISGAAPNGQMTGPDFQQAYRGLARTSRQAGNRIYGHEIGNALGQGQDMLVGALEQQNPGAYTDFLKANSANRHLSVLADAVNAAKNQIGDAGEPLFTPAQLKTAATANARTYSGKVAAASGNQPFNQLATDAQKVMSSHLGESGTFPRQVMGYLATGGLAAGGGMFGNSQGGPTGAAEGAIALPGLLTLLGTRRGQQLLTKALVDRTIADQVAGRAILRNPQVGGTILTAASLPPLLGPQAQ